MKPGFSMGACSQRILQAISRELATYFSLEITLKKAKI